MKRRRSSRAGKASNKQTEESSVGLRVIGASEFKARCLRILEEVSAGEEILVTKRGIEMARLSPARPRTAPSSRGSWKEMVKLSGEIVHSDWSEEFDATR